MTNTIGSLSDAAAALNGDGTYLGEGCRRAAYLINGVVYKVCLSSNDVANYTEWENIHALRPRLYGSVKIPRAFLYAVNGRAVMAMDYVEGQMVSDCYCWQEAHGADCISPEVAAMVSEFILDTGGQNIIVNSDGVWIIDVEI